MTKRTIRSGLGTVGLAILLMAPAGAFTFGGLAGVFSIEGEGGSAAVPWSRNTFVKLRAAGTHAVELPTRASSKLHSEKGKPGPQPVQNLHRVDGR